MASTFPCTAADEPSQIDTIIADRSIHSFAIPQDPCFPAYSIIASYMTGFLALAATVTSLATPIDHAYTHPLIPTARTALPEPSAAGTSLDAFDPAWLASAEMLPWELWYAVLHHARRNSWRDTVSHSALIWEPGVVWSELHMLGPSLIESFGAPAIYAPGDAEKISVPQTHAWTNVGGFVARLAAAGVWGVQFGVRFLKGPKWTLGQKAKVIMSNTGVGKGRHLDCEMPAAAVWMILAGELVWERRVAGWREEVELEGRFSGERWERWKGDFESVSRRGDVAVETREMAREAFQRMEELERGRA
ncbi:hypothetical protein BU16DRAFT_538992 [Lophium mytilinum]|uniref:Uncharacterized protein n=1 Tax=Lophium mytilinum TaxID=390894 RepID=A0A6A6QW64_9PEZI|nr:hypothetical protein BU16DRAFT_538992 [Lophium mytilinum]